MGKRLFSYFGTNFLSVLIYSFVAFLAVSIIYIPIALVANFFGYCLVPEGSTTCEGLENPFYNALILGLLSGVLTFFWGIYAWVKSYFEIRKIFSKSKTSPNSKFSELKEETQDEVKEIQIIDASMNTEGNKVGMLQPVE